MNFFRKIPSKLQSFNVTIPKKSLTNPFTKNNLPRDRHNKWDNVPGLYLPLEEYPRYRKDILKQSTENVDIDGLNDSRGSKRVRDPYGKRNDNHFDETYRKKRARDSYDDGDDFNDSWNTKKPRLADAKPSYIQYAIKQPSQHSDPHRKILENLFDHEITADGWKKKSDREIEYHTEIRGRIFYEMGKSVHDARDHVAATALWFQT